MLHGGSVNLHFVTMITCGGMTVKQWRRMKAYGLPKILFEILEVLDAMFGTSRMNFCVDIFAGEKAITKSFREKQLVAKSFELLDDPCLQNILGPEGFFNLTNESRQLVAHGIFAGGPPCKSWVFMSRSKSQRSTAFPLGNLKRQFVAEGNVVVSRVCMLSLMVMAIDGDIMIEQPISSIMDYHPKFQHMFSLQSSQYFSIYRIHVWMGNFGSQTPKSSVLWCSSSAMAELSSPLDRSLEFDTEGVYRRYQDAHGEWRVTGQSGLRGTQVYTSAFADAVRAIVIENTSVIEVDDSDDEEFLPSDFEFDDDASSFWQDADLASLQVYLDVLRARLAGTGA